MGSPPFVKLAFHLRGAPCCCYEIASSGSFSRGFQTDGKKRRFAMQVFFQMLILKDPESIMIGVSLALLIQ